ncbi:MAG: hypothetical protein KF683_11910 [Rubrivivax sp.]|nr:hypothetical protein [Rubrivivax sp.]
MSARRAALALAATAAVLAAPVRAQAPAAPGPAASSAAGGEIAPRLSPLLGLVLNRVIDAAVESATGQSTSGLFRRLLQRLNPGEAAQAAQALPLAPAAPGAAGAERVAAGAVTPALGYAMEQLDPVNFATLRAIPVAGTDPLLRTGDVFVLQFSTNLPGQVRLENLDPDGRVADLGTYSVLVDQLNRLPRDKGIQLQGRPGLERLRFYFQPCLPAEAATRPWAAEFAGQLPPCGSGALQVASADGGLGRVVPRALVNLAQPDPTMVFAGASDVRPGEVTLLEARIRHAAP